MPLIDSSMGRHRPSPWSALTWHARAHGHQNPRQPARCARVETGIIILTKHGWILDSDWSIIPHGHALLFNTRTPLPFKIPKSYIQIRTTHLTLFENPKTLFSKHSGRVFELIVSNWGTSRLRHWVSPCHLRVGQPLPLKNPFIFYCFQLILLLFYSVVT